MARGSLGRRGMRWFGHRSKTGVDRTEMREINKFRRRGRRRNSLRGASRRIWESTTTALRGFANASIWFTKCSRLTVTDHTSFSPFGVLGTHLSINNETTRTSHLRNSSSDHNHHNTLKTNTNSHDKSQKVSNEMVLFLENGKFNHDNKHHSK